tara:strand:- start:6115 stop:6642 length:528 start_codon:yes stop_codon:yes gene_type:complete
MKKDACFYLGTIKRRYSYKGELLVKTQTDNLNLYIDLKTIFIEIDKKLIPFIIEKCSIHKSSLLRIKLNEINNENLAKGLLQKDVYLPINLLPKLKGKKFYFHEVIGFKAICKKEGLLGLITSINDQSPQPFFIINNTFNEILIPIHDDLIINLDRNKKIVFLNLPNGLTDLYRK